MTPQALEAPEFSLLIAATARPPSERHQAVLALADRLEIDWQRVLQLVDRHRVAPLVFDALSAISDRIPASFLIELRARAIRDRVQSLQSIAVLGKVTSVLASAQIEATSIKGPALAHIAFGDATLRQCRDIDVLVPAHAIEAALAALSTIDCYPNVSAGLENPVHREALAFLTKDLPLVHQPSGIVVELHWRLTNNPRLLPPTIMTSRQTVDLGGIAVNTLGDDDLLLYLCVHGAKHLWFRLKWLADIYALLAGQSPEELAAFFGRGAIAGLHVPVGQTLLMLNRVYGLPLPEVLRRSVDRSWRTRCLTRAALHYQAMTQEPDARWYIPYGMVIGQIGFRSEAGYIAREIGSYCVDLPTVARMGGTRWSYAAATLGRPFFWLARRIVDRRAA